MRGARSPIVLKLGGAQALGGRLGEWLQAISAQRGRIVVVPGGGPFADVVRATQSQIGFSDEAAHEMALMAMGQFGRALASLAPGFVIAQSRTAILQALKRGLAPIWSPERMALQAGLPMRWDLTSDSLAAWLAGALGASRLILVKHGAAGSARDLAARGVVDPLFADYLATRAFLAPPDRADGLGEALDGDAYPEITLSP